MALITASLSLDDDEDLKSPSTAVRIGFDLKRMLNTKMAMGIKHGNEELEKEATEFRELMNIEGTEKVTHLARITLDVRKFNKARPLPTPEDLKKLQDHLKSEIAAIDLHVTTPDNFRRIVALPQTRLLLFKKMLYP